MSKKHPGTIQMHFSSSVAPRSMLIMGDDDHKHRSSSIRCISRAATKRGDALAFHIEPKDMDALVSSILSDVGKRLTEARALVFPEDSQEAFGKRIGVGKNTVYRMENGAKGVGFDTYIRAAIVLGMAEQLSSFFDVSKAVAELQIDHVLHSYFDSMSAHESISQDRPSPGLFRPWETALEHKVESKAFRLHSDRTGKRD